MLNLAEGKSLLVAAGDRKVNVGDTVTPADWDLLIWLRNNASELIEMASTYGS